MFFFFFSVYTVKSKKIKNVYVISTGNTLHGIITITIRFFMFRKSLRMYFRCIIPVFVSSLMETFVSYQTGINNPKRKKREKKKNKYVNI